MTRSGTPGPPGLLLDDPRPGPGRVAGFLVLVLTVAVALATFSAFPWTASPPGAALLKVAFKHVTAPAAAGAALSREDLEKLPRHMRPQGGDGPRTGRRRDAVLRVTLDGRALLDRTYRPGGLRRDGPTFVYEELPLPPGRHVLEATLAEVGELPDGPGAAAQGGGRLVAELDVGPGEVLLLERSDAGLALHRGRRSPAGGA